MKEKFKNFIAFTLSEMMIVLLIFSVLTAATLPAITTRKENPNPNISSSGGDESGLIWKEADDGSIFYDYTGSNPKEVVINSSRSINSLAVMSGELRNVGAAVFLTSPSTPTAGSKVGINSYGNSTIEFATGGSNSGRIALDTLPSIFVGFDNTLSQEGSVIDNAYSTLIGRSLGGTTVKALGSTMIGTDTGNSITGGSATDEYSVFIGNNIPLYQTSEKQVVIDSSSTGNNVTFASNSSESVLIGQNVAYNLVPRNSVVMGARAGYSATKFSANNSIDDVIIGKGASYTNKMLTAESVIIGAYAGSCNYAVNFGRRGNVMIGSRAFSGKFYDVAIGPYAGYIEKNPSATVKPATVKIGFYAAYGVRGSAETVYIGSYSGSIAAANADANAGASQAVFIGKSAGNSSSAMGSIGIGEYALGVGISRESGFNVCIGKKACSSIYAPFSYSTAIGTEVMGPVNNGSEIHQKNLLIGSACYASAGGSNWSNNTCIGNGDVIPVINSGLDVVYATGSYSLWGYRSSVNYSTAHTIIIPSMKNDPTSYNKSSIVLYAGKVYGGSILRAYSDKRLKENIVPVKHSIDKVRKINIYQYNMKNDSSKDPKIGVIAQELKEIYPQAVSMFNNYFTVNSDWIFFATVRAIKDLDEIVQNVQKELDLAKLKFNNLLVRVNKLEVRMNNISNSNRTLILKLNEIEQAKKMERK